VRWVTTNPNTAYSDVFHVESATNIALISLAAARTALAKRAGSSTASDADLRDYIEAVTPVVEDITGPQIIRTVTETFDGGRDAVLLTEQPVSITSLLENGVALVENQTYFVSYGSGIIYRGTPIAPYWWLGGYNNVVVTYTVGLGLVAAHLWQGQQQGARPAIDNPAAAGDTVTTPGGFAVPRLAAQLLQPSPTVQLPGFA
jgi:hypothetical protein